MRINELEFQDKNGNEINPTKEQMATLIAYLQQENTRLKAEFEELKNTAILQKFKVGDIVYVIRKIKQDIRKGKIKSTWQGSHIDNFIRFRIYINGANDVTRQESEIFSTEQEAEEALKKLNKE